MYVSGGRWFLAGKCEINKYKIFFLNSLYEREFKKVRLFETDLDIRNNNDKKYKKL